MFQPRRKLRPVGLGVRIWRLGIGGSKRVLNGLGFGWRLGRLKVWIQRGKVSGFQHMVNWVGLRGILPCTTDLMGKEGSQNTEKETVWMDGSLGIPVRVGPVGFQLGGGEIVVSNQ